MTFLSRSKDMFQVAALCLAEHALRCAYPVVFPSVLIVKDSVAASSRCALALSRVHSQADGQWLHSLKGAIAGISVALHMQGSL